MYCPQCGVETGDIAGLCDKCRNIEKQENIRKQKIAETHRKIKVLYLVGIGMLFIQILFMFFVPILYVNVLDAVSEILTLTGVVVRDGGYAHIVLTILDVIAICLCFVNRSRVEKDKKSAVLLAFITTIWSLMMFLVFVVNAIASKKQEGIDLSLTIGGWLYIVVCVITLVVFNNILNKIKHPVPLQSSNIVIKKPNIVSKWVSESGASLILYSDGRYTMVNSPEPSGRWEAVGDKKIRLFPDSGVMREIDIETDAEESYINLGGYESFYKDVYPEE